MPSCWKAEPDESARADLKDATDKAAVSVDNVSDALSRKLAKGTAAAVDLEKATKDVDKALKALGIDPKKFEEPIANIIKAFTDLAKNPAVRIVGATPPSLPAKVSSAEQSNTSVFYGDRLILKLYRKLDAGINPDFEIGRYLTDRGFERRT